MRRQIIIVLLGLLSIALLVGCGAETSDEADGNEKDSTSESDELTVYASFPEEEASLYLNEFEKETGITVNFIRIGTGEALARLEAEKDNPQASIWYGGPSETFMAAADKGLLQQYDEEKLDNLGDLPDGQLDSDEFWLPVYLGALGFATNTEWLEKNDLSPPESWEDLQKPVFKDNVMMAHPGASGTGYAVVATLVQILGEDEAFTYLEGLHENIRQYTKSGSAPAEYIGLGEAAVGVAYAHDLVRPKVEGYPITVTYPSEGTGLEVGAVALVKDGPEEELENAYTFLNWATSEQGQSIYAENDYYRTPLNSQSQVADEAPELSDLTIIDYDAKWAGEKRESLVERFNNQIQGEENLK